MLSDDFMLMAWTGGASASVLSIMSRCFCYPKVFPMSMDRSFKISQGIPGIYTSDMNAQAGHMKEVIQCCIRDTAGMAL